MTLKDWYRESNQLKYSLIRSERARYIMKYCRTAYFWFFYFVLSDQQSCVYFWAPHQLGCLAMAVWSVLAFVTATCFRLPSNRQSSGMYCPARQCTRQEVIKEWVPAPGLPFTLSGWDVKTLSGKSRKRKSWRPQQHIMNQIKQQLFYIVIKVEEWETGRNICVSMNLTTQVHSPTSLSCIWPHLSPL